MPAPIQLSDRPLELSPEFTYEVGPGSDAVYVAAFQGAHPLTDEQKLEPGDKLDSQNTLTAFTLGDAVLLQYGHEETAPKDEAPKAKPAAKKSAAKKDK